MDFSTNGFFKGDREIRRRLILLNRDAKIERLFRITNKKTEIFIPAARFLHYQRPPAVYSGVWIKYS